MTGILKNMSNVVTDVSDLLNGVAKIEDVQNKINNLIIDLNLAKEQRANLLATKRINPTDFSRTKLKDINDNITEIVKKIRELKSKKFEKVIRNKEALIEDYKQQKQEHINNYIHRKKEIAKKKAEIKAQAALVMGKNKVIRTGGKTNKKRTFKNKHRKTVRK